MSTDDTAIPPEEFPSPKDVRFGPFEDPIGCDFEYGGIEETCANDATHVVIFENEVGHRFRMARCDDHGFPFIVRERHYQELGHTPTCEVCEHMDGKVPLLANDVAYKATLPTDDGGERDVYFCESCRERLRDDVEVSPVDSI